MHSYGSLRLFLCPAAGSHLCFVFARGAFRVIRWGLVGLAAGGMLGGGARRGAGGVGRLDVLLVWKKLFNYVKEVTQRAAYTDGKKRKKRKRERENKQQMSNGVNMRRGRGRDGGMRGVELGKETLTTETTEVRAFVFRPDEEEVAPKQHWLYQDFHHFYCERFFWSLSLSFPATWRTNRSTGRHFESYHQNRATKSQLTPQREEILNWKFIMTWRIPGFSFWFQQLA